MAGQGQENVVFFDGVCNLCNSSVQVVLKNDRNHYFQFASLQSDFAKSELPANLVNDTNLKSIVLKKGDRVLTKSSAALNIAKSMDGLWSILYIFMIIPKPIRDFVYNIIAENRYKWFGKQDSCMLPSPEYANRFID